MRVLMLTRYDRLGASSRLRSMQYLPWLKAVGIDVTIAPLFSDAYVMGLQRKQRSLKEVLRCYAGRFKDLFGARSFDLVWIEKEALPWLPAFFEAVFLRGVPYVLDYDDAIFHNYDLNRRGLIRFGLGKKLDRLMAGARLVVGGNEYLAQRARDAGAPWVEVVPTVIDLERYKAKVGTSESGKPVRVVWIGSPSTGKYLVELEKPLQELARRHKFVLRVIGATVEMPGVDVECVGWSEISEVDSIAQCDVGIMPLADSPWERGKCGYKLIQYMAVSLPVVASSVGVNVDIVAEGRNGFLAGSPAEWTNKLELLLDDSNLRHRMGAEGRSLVEREYCSQQTGPRLVGLLKRAVEGCSVRGDYSF